MVCAKARPWLTSEMEGMQMALEQGVPPPGLWTVRGLTGSGLAAQQEVSSGASQH